MLDAGKLKVYVYSEMLALFAGAPYASSLSDLSNLAAHLTNTCRQTDAAPSGPAGTSDSSVAAPAAPAAASLPKGPQSVEGSAEGSTAQQPASSLPAGSAGAHDFDEADVVRLLSELPDVSHPAFAEWFWCWAHEASLWSRSDARGLTMVLALRHGGRSDKDSLRARCSG